MQDTAGVCEGQGVGDAAQGCRALLMGRGRGRGTVRGLLRRSHSIARKRRPCGVTPCATYETMAGWRRDERSWASRVKRLVSSGPLLCACTSCNLGPPVKLIVRDDRAMPPAPLDARSRAIRQCGPRTGTCPILAPGSLGSQPSVQAIENQMPRSCCAGVRTRQEAALHGNRSGRRARGIGHQPDHVPWLLPSGTAESGEDRNWARVSDR